MSDAMSPILIITGMHRSGTSLTASLLQSAGVDIGTDLIAASEGNIKGHFEDLAVVQFHENVLKANSLPPEGWVTQPRVTEIPESLLAKAKEIISRKRETSGITGWKDPRGTLFLDFWQSQLPEAKFIFLYRAPWEVVDSLYRRGDQIFSESPQLALDFWLSYNGAILQFYQRHSEQSLLLNVEDLRADPKVLSSAIAQKFGLTLSFQTEIYDPSLFQGEVSDTPRSRLLQKFFPQLLQTYQQLEAHCDLSPKQQRILNDAELTQPAFDETWLLQDWLQMRGTQRELAKVQQSERELTTALAQTTQALQEAQAQVAQQQDQMTRLQDTIRGMESSKFWKMRQLWMRVKQKLPLINHDD
ncbi:MAG: hypothetical protein GVY17_01445 [Cyanobacteria bacterium]|jgi:hypothetical protein|nr:hypothetical protein [Cyanobacteria bacterium GSL.Bin21]